MHPTQPVGEKKETHDVVSEKHMARIDSPLYGVPKPGIKKTRTDRPAHSTFAVRLASHHQIAPMKTKNTTDRMIRHRRPEQHVLPNQPPKLQKLTVRPHLMDGMLASDNYADMALALDGAMICVIQDLDGLQSVYHRDPDGGVRDLECHPIVTRDVKALAIKETGLFAIAYVPQTGGPSAIRLTRAGITRSIWIPESSGPEVIGMWFGGHRRLCVVLASRIAPEEAQLQKLVIVDLDGSNHTIIPLKGTIRPSAIAWSEDMLAVGTIHGEVVMYRIFGPQLTRTHHLDPLGTGPVRALAFAPESQTLYAARGPVVSRMLWETKQGPRTRQCYTGPGPVAFLQGSPTGVVGFCTTGTQNHPACMPFHISGATHSILHICSYQHLYSIKSFVSNSDGTHMAYVVHVKEHASDTGDLQLVLFSPP